MLAAGGWLAKLPLDPLPHLGGPAGIDVDDHVFVDGLGHLAVDLAAGGVVGERAALGRAAGEGGEAPLVRHGNQGERPVAHHDVELLRVVIPTKLLNEERAEVEVLQELTDTLAIESHLSPFYFGSASPIEQMMRGSRVCSSSSL